MKVFLTKQDGYENEVLQFLQNGHYNSEFGKTMPLAMANALGVSFVILTSLSSSPVYLICPQCPSSVKLVLHMAYTAVGPGHYDGLVLKESMGKGTNADTAECRCGVNCKDNKENCGMCTPTRKTLIMPLCSQGSRLLTSMWL